jgi:hypothetical protein
LARSTAELKGDGGSTTTRGAPRPDPPPSPREREDLPQGYATARTHEREATPPRVTPPWVGHHTMDPVSLGLDPHRPAMDPPGLGMDLRR